MNREAIWELTMTLRKLFHRIRDEVFPKKDEFDRTRNVDTSGRVSYFLLRAPYPTWRYASSYQATNTEGFREAINALPPESRNHVFIDLGCGKGRVILLAKDYGFRRVIGVEFSPRLAEIARRNTAGRDDISVIVEDAAHFVFPDEPMVIFLFNPFGAPVLSAVADNLRRQRSSGFMLYLSPIHAHILRAKSFTLLNSGEFFSLWKF